LKISRKERKKKKLWITTGSIISLTTGLLSHLYPQWTQYRKELYGGTSLVSILPGLDALGCLASPTIHTILPALSYLQYISNHHY